MRDLNHAVTVPGEEIRIAGRVCLYIVPQPYGTASDRGAEGIKGFGWNKPDIGIVGAKLLYSRENEDETNTMACKAVCQLCSYTVTQSNH